MVSKIIRNFAKHFGKEVCYKLQTSQAVENIEIFAIDKVVQERAAVPHQRKPAVCFRVKQALCQFQSKRKHTQSSAGGSDKDRPGAMLCQKTTINVVLLFIEK